MNSGPGRERVPAPQGRHARHARRDAPVEATGLSARAGSCVRLDEQAVASSDATACGCLAA
jgi:hypothetical protein